MTPESAFDLLAAGNVSEAVTAITRNGDAQDALESLAELCKRAYRDLKSVPAMTAVAREAIGFGLRCADEAADAESARAFKTRVRAIAYNTGANCWPGWSDPVEIGQADIAEGLKLAARNYELVVELGLGDKATGSALWLIGALQMAAADCSTAALQFQRAEEAFRAAQLTPQVAMARGYAALARKALPESHSSAAESLAAEILALRSMESPEAQFFADQLITADKVFSSRWTASRGSGLL